MAIEKPLKVLRRIFVFAVFAFGGGDALPIPGYDAKGPSISTLAPSRSLGPRG